VEPRQAQAPAHASPATVGPQPGSSHMLPVLIFGIVEVRRLKREIEALNEFMRQARLREAGKQAALPRVSRLLDALATDNNRNLLQDDDRQELYDFLTSVENDAPCVNISFASDPSSAFTAKVVTWLRSNIHPAILLQAGLQPSIAAGCVVRTPNHIFDFSLREHFTKQHDLLMKSLEAAAPAVPAQPVAPTPVAPVTAAAPAASAVLAVSAQPAPAAQPAATGGAQ
jgi:F0F1-type ATP synthase delta subunit